jgi:hypothetical protein
MREIGKEDMHTEKAVYEMDRRNNLSGAGLGSTHIGRV